MASKSLGTLTLDLVAKTGGFVGGLNKSEREMEKWRKNISAKASRAGKAIGVGLALGATAAVAGLSVLVRSSLESIDAQAKLAQRLRTSFDSLSNLARAGDLAGVSMQQIEVASRSLEVNLGKAAQGATAQVEALDRLKLSAEAVSKLPLDERIKAINTALKENVSVTERAAVAADLFGSRGALAIQMLNPATIEEAARQVAIFGINLSDIDAAKIEQANDAMSTFGLLSEGIGKQLTVELAPILKAVGDEFLRSADAAGGLGTVVQDTTRDVIRSIGFIVNAADGVGRAFELAADSAIVAISALAAGAAENVADLLSLISVLPGVDYSEAEADVRRFAAIQKGVFSEATKNIQATLLSPLAGDELVAFYDKAQAAGQAAAESAVAARAESGKYNEALESTTKELEKISVTAKKMTLSKDIQETIKAQEAYAALVAELRTDEEKLNDTLTERLAILQAVGQVNSETGGRVAASAFAAAPEFAGLAPEIGGAFGELGKINEAEKALDDWYSTQLDMLAEYRASKSELSAQWDEQEAALNQEHQDRLAQIEGARYQASLVAASDLFGNLADLTGQFAGEQSDAYKIMFAAQKAAAIAQSIIAIQAGIAQAAANPFPANLAAMASVAAATASIIGNITSTSIQGQAHDGMDSIPATGTWNLQKGERVTTQKTSAKLDRTLSDVQSNMREGGGSSQNIRIVNSYDSDEMVGGYMGSKAGEKAILNIMRKNRRTIQALTV